MAEINAISDKSTSFWLKSERKKNIPGNSENCFQRVAP